MKKAGAKGFDAYAHHPYYGAPRETPSTPPPPGIHGNAPTAITLGNINLLIREVTRLYGNKRIWITEYGYQTNPPDRIFGVSFANQARYLTQAYGIAKRHPRIDMFLWFLLRDERRRRRGLAVGPADLRRARRSPPSPRSSGCASGRPRSASAMSRRPSSSLMRVS